MIYDFDFTFFLLFFLSFSVLLALQQYDGGVVIVGLLPKLSNKQHVSYPLDKS